MENKDFDTFIQSSVERITPPFSESNWERMEEALDSEEGYSAHDPIDEIARRKIRHLDASPSARHWERMSDMLDNEFSVLRRIYRYKLIETGFVLLVLFTLINFWPAYPKWFRFNLQPAAPNGVQTPGAVARDHAATDQDKSIIRPADARDLLPNSSAGLAPIARAAGNETSVPGSQPSENIDVLQPSAMADKPVNDGQPLIAADDNPDPASNATEAPSQDIAGQRNVPAAVFTGPVAWHPVASVSQDIAVNRLKETDPNLPQKVFRLGIISGFDLDHATIPYSSPYENEPPYRQWSTGISNGITAGLSLHSWELTLGAIYSGKNYSSNKVIQGGSFYTGYYLDSLRTVELNLFKAPVSVQREIVKKGRTTLYAMAGAVLHIALTGNYDRDIARWGNISASSSTALRSAVERDGILEGGKFNENFYVSADAGLGLEYAITPGLSVYAQGHFQHHLGALGPNRDKLNTVSFDIGAKHRL